jgi:protein phosphatase
MLQTMRIVESVALTQLGTRRKVNEDALLDERSWPLFAVADGTGSGGAAEMAIEVVKKHGEVIREHARRVRDDASTASRLVIGQYFQRIFEDAGRQIQRASAGNGSRLACTLVAATVLERFGYVAHVGDSRAYLFRKGELRCLTNDHTLAMMQLHRGEISQSEYLNSPFRHTLSQALGVTSDLNVDIAEIRLTPGDVLCLCSNGLHRVVGDEALRNALQEPDLPAVGRRMLSLAEDAKAPDNVTVLLLRVDSDEEHAVDVATDKGAEVLRGVFLFTELSVPEWLAVAPFLDELKLEAGTVIFRENDKCDAFYAVARGSVELRRGNETVATVPPGGHFGELALAGAPRRDTSAVATSPSVVFALTRESFLKLVRTKPILGTHLVLPLVEELGQQVQGLSKRILVSQRALLGLLG